MSASSSSTKCHFFVHSASGSAYFVFEEVGQLSQKDKATIMRNRKAMMASILNDMQGSLDASDSDGAMEAANLGFSAAGPVLELDSKITLGDLSLFTSKGEAETAFQTKRQELGAKKF